MGCVLAAAMQYFHLNSLKDTPTKNAISPYTNKDTWITHKHAVERIKESYAMANELFLDQDDEGASKTVDTDSNLCSC